MFERHLEEQFADQFEPHDSGFLYRKSLRGAPVPVTAAERDAFIKNYCRGARILLWSLRVAVIVMIVALTTYVVAAETELQDWWLYLGIALILAGYMIAWHRLWNAPAAELQRRSPVGGERSGADLRRMKLYRLSWGEMFALGAAIGIAVAVNLPDERAEMSLGDWILIVFFGFGLLGWCYAAIVKLRLRE